MREGRDKLAMQGAEDSLRLVRDLAAEIESKTIGPEVALMAAIELYKIERRLVDHMTEDEYRDLVSTETGNHRY